VKEPKAIVVKLNVRGLAHSLKSHHGTGGKELFLSIDFDWKLL